MKTIKASTMSPVFIETLLHYHVHGFDEPNPLPPSVQEAIAWLRRNKLAEIKEDNTGELTERGRVLVEMLCNTPLPEPSWSDPRES